MTTTTTLTEGKRLKKLPLDLINLVGLDDGETESHDLFDERVFNNLTPVHEGIIADMKANGFNPAHPIEVRRNKDTGKYDVVTGRQRVKCARAAGLEEVQCLVVTTKGARAIEAVLSENELREQDNVLVRGKKIRRLMDADPSLTHKDIALKIGVHESTIKNILRVVDDGVEALHEAVRTEQVTPAIAYQVAAMDPEFQAEVLEQMLMFELSPKQQMDFVQEVKAEEKSGSHDPVEKASKKLADIDFYGKLPKSGAEYFMALTAELDGPVGAAFREGIRFAFEQKQVADDGNVPGLKEAFAGYMKEVKAKQRAKQKKAEAKEAGE